MSDKQLHRQLELLNQNLQKLNSPLHRFFIGLITGIGSALGATIFAGLILFLLSRFVRSIEDIPLLVQFIEAIKVNPYLPSR